MAIVNSLKLLCFLNIAGVLTMGTATVAGADTVVVEDPQDTGDVMDLDLAVHGHGDSERTLVHTISTYEAWSSDDFVFAELKFWFADGDQDIDRVLTVSVDSQGGFVGTMCTADTQVNCNSSRGSAKVYQSGERTLVMEFDKRLLKKGIQSYRWKAFLHYHCNPPEGGTCAPPPPDTHVGRIRHVL